MRGFGLRIGGVAAGLVLAAGLAMPAAAQDLSDPDVFGVDVLGCVAIFGISDCVEEVLENQGLEEEEGEIVVIDPTPLNPNDTAADVVVFVDDVVFPSEVVEE